MASLTCILWQGVRYGACTLVGSIIEARRQSGMQSVTIRANLRPFRDHDAREAISCNQLQSVAIRVNRGQSVVKQRLGRVNHKSNHMQSVPIRANQCQFETIQRQSEAISCNQMQSGAISGQTAPWKGQSSKAIRCNPCPSEPISRPI